MNCEEVELSLTSGEALSAEALAHVESCESCKAFSAELPGLLGDAALPALSVGERARLEGLSSAVWRRYQADAKPKRSPFRQVVSLALAAGVGALVTSAVFKLSPQPAKANAKPDVALTQPADSTGFGDSAFELASAADEGSDEESLEVSWPSLNEGDVP